MRLARVGIETVMGYLANGFSAWEASGLPIARLTQWEVAKLRDSLRASHPPRILDVRSPGEFAGGHVEGALSVPLPQVKRRLESLGLDKAAPLAIICGSGYRSSAAASLLEAAGYKQLINIVGGMKAWLGGQLPCAATSSEKATKNA